MNSHLPGVLSRLAAAILAAALTLAPGSATAVGAAFVPTGAAVEPPSGARQLCRSYAWACARGGAPLTEAQIKLAAQVSRSVNRAVREIADQAQYGRAEHWALPTGRGGDCEDFALLKKRELVARGLPADRRLIASGFDRRGNPHAVLVLRTARGDLVLDNLTDRVVGWRETGYAFMRMQDPADPRRWVSVMAGGFMG